MATVTPPQLGHSLGHSAPESPAGPRRSRRAADAPSPALPAVCGVRRVCAALGVSRWTLYRLEAAGALTRVRYDRPDGRPVRRTLYDEASVRRLVESGRSSV